VELKGDKVWKRADFVLPDAVFGNAQNGGADFRLDVTAAEFYVRKVQLVRPGLKTQAYSPADGFTVALYGDADHRYILESSTNLIDWRALTDLWPQGDAKFFTDLAARSRPHGWYRAWRAP
jgi:hypothetical protein